MNASEDVLTRAAVVADIAEAIGVGPQELTDETNLLDAGIDSIRVMTLADRWRVSFVTLAEDPVVGAWVATATDRPRAE